ncbi:hypothetical protein TNCV_4712331 [Trichonephila clavipes]|nr:hypothetical protein TNCV_4712331 [Trichonephila clavipes]
MWVAAAAPQTGEAPAWVPARVFRIKITEKKGFVAMIENCVQFNSINGAVWRFLGHPEKFAGVRSTAVCTFSWGFVWLFATEVRWPPEHFKHLGARLQNLE